MSPILGTALVGVLLAALIGWIVYGMIRDKRQGKSSCGGSCGSCGHGCAGCSGCSGCSSCSHSKT